MDDKEIMNYILNHFNVNVINGPFTMDVTDLNTSTDYVLMAFGCQGGVPNTQLFTQPFTTTEPTAINTLSILAYTTEFVFCSIGVDGNGQPSKPWVSKAVTFRYDDRSDAQEFVDLLPAALPSQKTAIAPAAVAAQGNLLVIK